MTVITPTLTMGNNSQIADTATSGIGVDIVSGGNCPLDIIAPSTSSASISTSGGTFNIAPGPVGGPVPSGEALTFDQSTSGSTATLNFMGGAVTTTVAGANTTVTTGTTVNANNTITMNVNNGTLVNSGTIHSTTAAGLAGTINVLSTGTLGLQGVGSITVDPTAVGGGAGGTINVTAASTLTVAGGNLTANAITNGNGGKITVQSASATVTGATTLTMEANAAGVGNGGTIGFTTTGATGDITVGSTAGGLIFQAEGGATSGNGGTVNVSAGRNLTFNSGGGGSINVSPQSLTGNGGNVNLTGSTAAAGTMTLNPTINANGPTGGTGNGGVITVTNNSTNLLQIPAGVLSANSGTVGGIGGQVTVTNTQSGGVELEGDITATGVSNTGSGVGQGGQITVTTSGNVLLDGGTLNSSGVTGAASSGGTVMVTAASISQSAGSTEFLGANANGTGNGGVVKLTTTAAGGNITLGPNGGTTLNIQAEGGSTGSASGNGGSVTVSSAAGLSVLSAASVNVAPQGNNGNGGSITLTGSTVTASTLTLSANLNANGIGTGNGGVIAVTNNSANLLQIPDSVLQANSGTTAGVGGKISVTNTGTGGIELEGNVSATGVSNTAPTAGNSGQITINSGGNVQLDGGTLNVNGVTGAASTGGAIAITAASISQAGGSTESLTANANGTGNGGTVNLTTNATGGSITLGPNGGTTLNVQAEGGSTGSASGNGGSVTVSSAAALSVLSASSINVAPQGNNGNGGSITLKGSTVTPSTMNISSNLNASGAGTGNGGTIAITNNSSSPLQIQSGTTLSANSGATGGIGGQITVTNTGTGGISLGGNLSATGVSNTAPTAGNSGQITVNAGGNVSFGGGTINANGVTGAASSGGAVSISAASISQAASTTELLEANANGNANGGKVTLTTTAAGGDINLGSAGGSTLSMEAQGGSAGSTSGNGGSVTVSSAGALNIQSGAVDVSPQGTNGNGGTIALTASTVTPSAMTINTPLDADGIGTGSGGSVSLTDNSTFQLVVPAGLVSANSGATGGTGGQITVTNTGGGGISVADLSATGVANTAGTFGQITVNAGGASPGAVTLTGGAINANGTGAGNSFGGTVSITGGTFTNNAAASLTANAAGSSNGGTVSVTTLGAGGTISVGIGATALTLSATGGSVGSPSGNGGTVSLSAGAGISIATGAAISVNPLGTNGNGGSVLLTAGTAAAGTVQVGQGISANGAGTGNGGVVSIKVNDPTAQGITVGSTSGTGGYVDGNITADASATGSGNGGTVTIQNSAAASLNVLLNGGNISANQGATGALGNINFPTSVVTPQAVSVTGNGNLTGFVNSNGTSVLIFPQPVAATTLTVGLITATTGNAAAEVNCSNGSILNIPAGSKIQTTSPNGLDVVLMGTTVNNNGQVISNRDVDIQTGLLQGTGTYTIPRDLNISACMPGSTLTVNLPGVALTAGRNVNFDVNPATPGPIIVTVASISANAGAGLVQLNPGQYTATVTATSINGLVEDPNYLTQPSDTINITVNSAGIPLKVGNFNATFASTSTFTATNQAAGGSLQTVGPITANGTVANPVTLSADNITNNNAVTANTSDLVVKSSAPGRTLNVAMNATGSLIALAANVDFNGTTLANAGPISVTGIGTIVADGSSGTNGIVNLNMGTNTASVAATSIVGCVEDPNYPTNKSGSVTIAVTADGPGGGLMVGNFNATGTAASTFSATNTAVGGHLSTCGNITANGTALNPVTLSADNVTNANTVTANTSALVVSSGHVGDTLTVNNTGSLVAATNNVDFNGTALANSGPISVTGTGTINADGGSGFVYLNMGTGTATVAQTSIAGCIEDPNYPTNSSGSVNIAVSADGPGGGLMVGNFNATATPSSTFSGTNTAVGGHLSTCGNITANGSNANPVTLSADNITNAHTVTAITSALLLSSGQVGDALTVNNTGSLVANTNNVNFNGTALANATPLSVTGTGAISANGGNGIVNLNIGSHTANVTQGSISGSVEDPNYLTQASDTVNITVNSAAVPLKVGNFNATVAPTSTFDATNLATGGSLQTAGPITANGTVANPVTLSADNITNNNAVTANTSDLVVKSSAPGRTLNVAMNGSGSLTALNANVDFNGTALANAGPISVTGTGAIVADGTTGTNGIVNLNMGTNTASVAATSIVGCVEDPNYPTNKSGTVTIAVTADGPGGGLIVGNFNTTATAASTFSATNTAVGGHLSTCGNITANGTALNPVTLSADNVTNANTVTANTSALVVSSGHVGDTLTVNNTGSLVAATNNVDFNGTALANSGPISVTGTGTINADGGSGFVYLNMGTGTATVAQTSIAGCIEDPNYPTNSSGSVNIAVSADGPGGGLMVGNFNATATPSSTFSATNTAAGGHLSTCGNITANGSNANPVTLSADNITNAHTVTANSSALVLSSGQVGDALTVNNTGSLIANTNNVNFNGTALANATPLSVTGTGAISANGGNGIVNLNIGSHTANVTQGSISGSVEDPNYLTQASDTVNITVNSAAVPLKVGNFNATVAPSSTFDATNLAAGGSLQTAGPITANGTVANPVTLSADNITNNNAVTANTSDLVVKSSAPGRTLNVAMNGSGSLTALNANVDFNGTALANAGPISVTGTGAIVADGTTGTNGIVNLNLGTNTASVAATYIVGCVEDPNYPTNKSGSVSIAVTSDGPAGQLMVANFNATATASSTFSAVNTAVAGHLGTCGNITANGTGASPVTLSADNITNSHVVTAVDSDLVVSSGHAGDTLTVNNTGSLIATVGDVSFNGLNPANAGSIQITGTGTISADGGNGFVDLNIGTGTANVVQGTIAGCVDDPNADFANPQSGAVSVTVSSATTLQMNNFASTSTVTGINNGDASGNGDVSVCGDILGETGVILSALGTNGNITEMPGGIITTGPSGTVTLLANGPIGIGACPNNLIDLDTPNINANAPHGSVALSDMAPATIVGSNSANPTTGEWNLTDTANATPAISFASGSSISANNIILYAKDGSIDLTHANITSSNAGVVEFVANTSITGVPTGLSIDPTGTLEIASLTGSIGTIISPLIFNVANFSATATQGSVYVKDTSTGNVMVVLPPDLSPCGPQILHPNTALNDYFVVATNSSGTALLTGPGATITGGNVALISQNGSVGTSTDAISTAATKLTANAVNGPVYVADNNGTNGVTLSANVVFGMPYLNSGTTNFNLTESGNGPITINNNISTTAPGSQINLSDVGGTNGNIVEQSGTLTTNGGATGMAVLFASGTVGIGVCPNNLVLLDTPSVNANAPNGSVAISDSVAATITGSNSASSTSGEFHLNDADTSASAISFASGSSITAHQYVLYTPNGGINLNNANLSITNAGVAEIYANASITGSPTNISGAGSTLEIASLNGSIGTPTTAVVVSTPKLSATATNGSVYMEDNNTGDVTIVPPPNLAPCGIMINNPNTALNNFVVVATNSPGSTLTTGPGATITAPNVALISQNGSVGTPGTPASIVASNVTANAGNGDANVSDNNGASGVTLVPTTVFGNTFSNGASGSYTLTDAGSGPLTNNDSVAGATGVTLTTPGIFNNNGSVVSSTGDVTIQSTGPGNALTVNTGPGSLIQATIGDVNFNTPTNPGAITVTGGINGGTISAGDENNFNAGTGQVSTDNRQIIGCINIVTASSVSMTSYVGNLDFCHPIDTSSATGNGGGVTLIANGGSVNTSGIDTNGSGAGNTAGPITIDGATGVTLGDTNANGTNGASGGTVLITTPGTIAGTYVSATGSGTSDGGTVILRGNNVTLSGADGDGNSVDVNASGTGDGGLVNIKTTSNTPFQTGNNGAATGNGINGNIGASGVNGGFIILTNGGNLINYANIVANGSTGNGGNVLIQNSLTPGSKPLIVLNNGLIEADNNAGDIGLIGLNGGPGLKIFVNGTGSFISGMCVNIGNLDEANLSFINPPSGAIYTETTLTFVPNICARSPVNPVTPPTPPPGPPTPPNGGGSTPGGGGASSTSKGQSQLFGFLSFFASPSLRRQANVISVTPTDLTQVFNYTNLDQSPLFPDDVDYKNESTALIKGAKTYEHEFAAAEQSRLQSEGVLIASNTAHNYFNLDKGNVLFNPRQNIVVGTHEGNVYIGPGSHVLVMETGHDVMIYNLHDDAPERVSIVAANKKLVLEPGRVLVLSRQNTRDFESLNTPCHGIGYRNIKEVDLDKSIKAFYGDFSIPSALTMVVPLKKLLSSNDPRDKRTLERIIKTSSMLATFSPQNSPFRNGAMFR